MHDPCTVCQRSLDPFSVVSYWIWWPSRLLEHNISIVKLKSLHSLQKKEQFKTNQTKECACKWRIFWIAFFIDFYAWFTHIEMHSELGTSKLVSVFNLPSDLISPRHQTSPTLNLGDREFEMFPGSTWYNRILIRFSK